VIGVWVRDNCERHPRIAGGVVVILRHMNAWLTEHGHRTYSLDDFKSALEKNGLPVIEVAGTLLVPGLGFKEDCKCLPKSKPSSRSSRKK
jgi:hypothetical protein